MIRSLISLLALLLFSIFSSSCSENRNSRNLDPAHLGPDGMPHQLLTMIPTNNPTKLGIPSAAETKLKPVIDKGQRAVSWLNLVNSHRPPSERLNLADKLTKNPVPPETPKFSSIAIILEKYNERLQAIAPAMRHILDGTDSMTETPPLADELFLISIRELNSSYQAAIRWLLREPYLFYYAQQGMYDVRGYYFFQKENDVLSKLRDFSNLSSEKKGNFLIWLVQMCRNSLVSESDCTIEVASAITGKSLDQIYSKYLSEAKNNYESFFKAQPIRHDLKWNALQTELTQDFVLPAVSKVTAWLKTNVEEEWKAQNFQLKLNFVADNPISPFLEFVKGVTPHVSGTTHQTITMDPDYSLDDYTTQWTIRHEFGHVLGLPDCYLEFYDEPTETVTFYTIEPDNLMCAWGGKLQPSHIKALHEAYK